jgi:YHS domain-containing protein
MWAKLGLPCVMISCCGLLATAAAQQSGPEQAVHWQTNLNSARQQAMQSNRLVLIHFWSENCPPCVQMERDIFARPDAAAALEANYVPVKINVLSSPFTSKQWGVGSTPSEIILRPDGQVIERLSGGATVEQYLGKLNQIAVAVRNPRPSAPLVQIPGGPAPGAVGPDPSAAVADRRAAVTPFINPPFMGRVGDLRPQAPLGDGRMQSPPGVALQGPPPAVDPRTMANDPPDGAAARQPITMPGQPRIGDPFTPANPQRPSVPSPAGVDRRVADMAPGGPAVDPAVQPWSANRTSNAFPAEPGNSSAVATASAVSADRKLQEQLGLSERKLERPGATADRAAATAPPPGSPPMALDGYCAVTVTEKERWVKGDPRWGVIHRGRTYLFVGPEEAARFYDDPDHYAPMYSGYDVVAEADSGQKLPGRREYGAWYEGRMYLFATEANYKKFDQNAGYYAKLATQAVSGNAHRPSSSTPPAGDMGANLGPGASAPRDTAGLRLR